MDTSSRRMPRAFIAGTGRAGTSFLVQFLHACGLDCGDLERQLYFERANAGYEHHPLEDDLPYVVKNPSLHEYLEQIQLDRIEVQALIIPVRDLRLAAKSRVLRERAEVLAMMSDSTHVTTFGRTPGGVLYSLSVDDQERILAVGQARLVAWAVQHDVPLFLLAFPRLVDDADYLVDTLWPWLSRFTDRSAALDAHQRTAAPDKVTLRAEGEDAHAGDDASDHRATIERLQLEQAALEQAIEQLRRQQADPSHALRFEVGALMRLGHISEVVDRLSLELRDLTERFDRMSPPD